MCTKRHPEWGLHEDNTDRRSYTLQACSQSLHNTVYIFQLTLRPVWSVKPKSLFRELTPLRGEDHPRGSHRDPCVFRPYVSETKHLAFWPRTFEQVRHGFEALTGLLQGCTIHCGCGHTLRRDVPQALWLRMFWVLIAVGAAVMASIHTQSRDKVKDVPWTALAVAVGLCAVGDGLRNIGTGSAQNLVS